MSGIDALNLAVAVFCFGAFLVMLRAERLGLAMMDLAFSALNVALAVT